MPVLLSHPQHRDYAQVLTQTIISFYAVCGKEKGLSTLNSTSGTKEDCSNTHKITILNALLWSDLNMLYDHFHYPCSV